MPRRDTTVASGPALVLVGAGFANKGAEAMLRTVCSEISRRLPDPRFLLWDCARSHEPMARGLGLQPICLTEPSSKALRIAWTAYWWVRGGAKAGALRSREHLLAHTRAANLMARTPKIDGVIDISGYAYGDVWGTARVAAVLPLIEAAHALGAPVIFMPQAFGPFANQGMQPAVGRLLGGPKTSVYVRDEVSREHLESIAALDRLDKPVRADIVFAFEDAGAESAEALLRSMGCDHKRPLLGIAPNLQVYKRSRGEGAENEYLQALARLARHFIEQCGADVVLQANMIEPAGSYMDDLKLCDLIRRAVDQPSRCVTAGKYLDAPTSKALVGCFDYLVASRFHSLVFALAQGVPCSAIGWTHKYSELLEPFGLADRVFHLSLPPDLLLEKAVAAWNTRTKDAAAIRSLAERLAQETALLFDEVASTLHRDDTRGVS